MECDDAEDGLQKTEKKGDLRREEDQEQGPDWEKNRQVEGQPTKYRQYSHPQGTADWKQELGFTLGPE